MIVLRSHQVEGKDLALVKLREVGGFCLFMEQRTGKTYTAYAIAEELKPERILIACPKDAIPIWEAALKLFADLAAEVQIINLEALWSVRRKLRRWSRDALVIVDEAQRIKGRNTRQARALALIGRLSKWRLALSGQPIDKGFWQAWSIYRFIAPHVFGTRWKDFRERYLRMGGFMGYKIVGTKNEEEFYAKFDPLYYRVLLEDVKPVGTKIDPPNLVEFDLVESRHQYTSMDQRFMVELDEAATRKAVKRLNPQTGRVEWVKPDTRILAPMALAHAMKLHQLSGGFIYDTEKNVHRFGDEKLSHTGALLLRLGVPTVIVARFVPELHRIGALCRRLGISVTVVSRDTPFTGFETDVLVLQIRKGISIDLSKAEEMIFHSWNYSFLDYDQMKARIKSYTSVRARYHYLIANNTIDRDLYSVVADKQNLARLILDRQRRRLWS